MTDTPNRTSTSTSRRMRAAFAGLALPVVLLSACGGSSGSVAAAPSTATAGAPAPTSGAGAAVLPVASNPIANTSTSKVMTITNLIVENNVDSAGKAASDHLEFTIANSGTTPLAGIEVYYRFDDKTAGLSEGYYTKLPTTFEIPAGGKRTVHFDDTGASDHFPVNKFSLYATSKNALSVSVTIGATDAASASATVQKDAGGAEAAD